MTDTAIAETPEAAEQIQAVDDNAPMTVEKAAELVAARQAKNRGQTTEADEPEVPEPEEEEETTEEEVEEVTEEEEESEDVLSQIDLESLSDDQKAALAKELGSGAGKTIGKQRKQIRELEAKLKLAQEATKEAAQLKSSDNPYAGTYKVEDVEQKLNQAQTNVDYWDGKLDEALDNETTEIEHDGGYLTAKAVRAFVKQERAKLKDLKGRKSEIEKVASLFDDEDEKIETLRLDLALEDDASKAYDEYLNDPSFELVKNLAPDFALKLIDVFAHAAQAKNGTTKKKPAKRAAPKSKKANSIPKGGGSEGSMQSQLSVIEKIAYDPNKPIAERRKAAAKLRTLKSQLR